jgi:hypothetical protein
MLVLFSHMFFSISEHLCGWASEVIASVLLLVLFIEFCPYFYLVGFGLRTGLGQLRFLAPVKSAEDFPFLFFSFTATRSQSQCNFSSRSLVIALGCRPCRYCWSLNLPLVSLLVSTL